jgi:membrane-bound lytic murein transglycosylase B
MNRRSVLAAVPLTIAAAAGVRVGLGEAQAAESFASYVAGLGAQARAQGIPAGIAAAALGGLSPDPKVIHFDQHQPEFTLTWAQYRARTVTATRIATGRAKAAAERSVLASVRARFGVSAEPIMGIWGGETDFGAVQGDFQVINSLVTLAWYRNSRYFAHEAIAAMRIAARGQRPLNGLLGSWAGAMGQPQFMPSVYLTTAVDFAGTGRPNIWTNVPDTLASIGNYLHKAGWIPGLPSSEPVLIPPGFNLALAGRARRLPVSRWVAMGVRRFPGAPQVAMTTEASVLLPDGPRGEAFLVYANFEAIRRYNPSDLYALAIGTLGHAIIA